MSINDRLKMSREKAGYMSAADAIRAFGWAEAAYRHHENGTRGIPANKIETYARAFNVGIEWLMTGRGKTEGLGKVSPSKSLPVLGAVQGGSFIEAVASPDVDIYMPVAVDPDYSDYEQYLLQVNGPSMNLFYPDGSYAHCVHIEYSPEDIMPDHGDHVIVERRKGDLREVTIKEYTLTNNGPELWPRSTDQAWQSPIQLTDDTPIDEVQITALVIGCYIKRRK